MTAHNQHARFAASELTPVDRETARALATQTAQLAAYMADACLTIDTLWSENERLQAGIDRNLGLVAELRGRLGKRAATIDPALIERLRVSVESARQKRFLAEAIDVDDLQALLAFVEAMGSGQ
jgi:hypothetical protein